MNDYVVSTSKQLLDVPMIHEFLSKQSYWAEGRTLTTVQKSIENSFCFGIYNQEGRQIAFARVVSDFAIYAYIMDVFVLEEFRGLGIGKMLMHGIVSHPDLEEVRKFCLGTADAHGLYNQFGFNQLNKPENMMELLR